MGGDVRLMMSERRLLVTAPAQKEFFSIAFALTRGGRISSGWWHQGDSHLSSYHTGRRRLMGRLQGKVAFITGAGAGIAKASALAFIREGAKVALAEIKPEVGRATEKQARDAGGDAIFIETDVTQDAAVKRAIDAAVERYGRLDILMNCAGGSMVEDVPVHKMDLAVFERTIALNLRHPFLCCRHGIPHMIAGGGGSIINFSTWLALIGGGKPAYAAAQGGLVSFPRTPAPGSLKE